MKKTKNIIAVLSLYIVAVSCNESNFEKPIMENIDDTNITNRVVEFRQHMTQKSNSDESVIFSEAILLMEGSFNYYYGHPNENFEVEIMDTIKMDIAYNLSDVVNFDDLQDVYVELNNRIFDCYSNCAFESKHVKYVDIDFFMDEQNRLITFVSIGSIGVQKNTIYLKNDLIWLNATPFNGQQDLTWIMDNSYAASSGWYYDTEGEVAVAINDGITIPPVEPNSWVWNITNTGWLNQPVQNLSQYYIENPHIAGPLDEVFCNGGGMESNFMHLQGAQVWPAGCLTFCGFLPCEAPYVGYRHMNKYWNVCMAAITIHKPGTKKPIDAVFAVEVGNSNEGPHLFKGLYGVFKITYARVQKEIIAVPSGDPTRL